MKNNKSLRKVVYETFVYRRYKGHPVGLPIDYKENIGYFHKFIGDSEALVEDIEGYLHKVSISQVRFFNWNKEK